MSLHSTAVGKTILSVLSDDRVEEILSNSELRPRTEHTVVDRDELRERIEAIESGDFERARRIRPYENLRAESGPNNPFAAANNVPAVKYGVDLAGLVVGPVREPLVDLSDSDKERAETYYTQIVDSGDS
ncbi:5-dehydro-4-deoxyglucarate dehydratase [Natrialba aegyptia DSM 13077]|uniref:5-dehydro-4-deoxyglucarate dehydratase n=1 Tax=Natrialba aegyptia DSM 13077 TaxID=1227491 RepID=M0AGG5_9EURY|nr:IclR family transcriptional regulator C-terminal domain-containing protein [Natrialba aegyptia]ELY97639.1 5-dehydro-4-deoxyglucarate dehydratase [Natrialba aegyptia DSM 13077]